MSYLDDGTAVCDIRFQAFHISSCRGPLITPWPAIPGEDGKPPSDTFHICADYIRWAFGDHCKSGILGQEAKRLADRNVQRWYRERQERLVRGFARELDSLESLSELTADWPSDTVPRLVSVPLPDGRRLSRLMYQGRILSERLI